MCDGTIAKQFSIAASTSVNIRIKCSWLNSEPMFLHPIWMFRSTTPYPYEES
jgi:hypothetical protein